MLSSISRLRVRLISEEAYDAAQQAMDHPFGDDAFYSFISSYEEEEESALPVWEGQKHLDALLLTWSESQQLPPIVSRHDIDEHPF